MELTGESEDLNAWIGNAALRKSVWSELLPLGQWWKTSKYMLLPPIIFLSTASFNGATSS